MRIEDLKIGSLYKIIPNGITFFQDFYTGLAHYNYHGFDFSIEENAFPVVGEFDFKQKVYFIPNDDGTYEPVPFLLLDLKRVYSEHFKREINPGLYYALQILRNEQILWCILDTGKYHEISNLEIKEANE